MFLVIIMNYLEINKILGKMIEKTKSCELDIICIYLGKNN